MIIFSPIIKIQVPSGILFLHYILHFYATDDKYALVQRFL